MIGCILDGSVALSWVLPDEGMGERSGSIDFVIERGAVVPGIWALEVAHGLFKAERRRRISSTERRSAIEYLATLSVEVDGQTATKAWGETLLLAERHGLTPYDASYLELAIRLALPLATRDRDLRAAATACGVTLLD